MISAVKSKNSSNENFEYYNLVDTESSGKFYCINTPKLTLSFDGHKFNKVTFSIRDQTEFVLKVKTLEKQFECTKSLLSEKYKQVRFSFGPKAIVVDREGLEVDPSEALVKGKEFEAELRLGLYKSAQFGQGLVASVIVLSLVES